MHQREWASIVARLNLNWPGQQITKPTADEWFGPLADFPAAEVWGAVDRCRQDQRPGTDGRPRGAWLPNLADILAAIDANWREAAAERRELEARAARAERNGRGGSPAPPETKEAIRLLEATMTPPGHPGHMDLAVALARIAGLGEQLNERVDRAKRGELV